MRLCVHACIEGGKGEWGAVCVDKQMNVGHRLLIFSAGDRVSLSQSDLNLSLTQHQTVSNPGRNS